MPNFYRHSIFILALSSSLSSYAINFPDTTIQKKNVTISGTNSMTDISQITDIQRGLNMIRADSMEQGIHLVTSGVKHTFAATKLDRIMNFSEMEFIGLVEDLDNGKLSEPEKKLGTAVFRIIFQKKIEPNEKTMEPYFKDVPNTRFVKRVRLTNR